MGGDGGEGGWEEVGPGTWTPCSRVFQIRPTSREVVSSLAGSDQAVAGWRMALGGSLGSPEDSDSWAEWQTGD